MIRAAKAAAGFPRPQTKTLMGQTNTGQTMNNVKKAAAQDAAKDNMASDDYNAMLQTALMGPQF